MVAFYLLSTLILISAGSEQVIRFFETRPQVTAFFKDETAEAKIMELQSNTRKIPGVIDAKYISKQQALALYREQNQDDPLLLEMVTADILPASLEISATSPDVLTQVAQMMTSQKDAGVVEEVVYQKNIIDNLVMWTRVIRYGGLGLLAFFLASAMFMIVVIVSMKVAARKTEIEISRLLGASSGQIAVPFLLEGIFYGIAGGMIGWGMAYLTLLYSTPLIVNFMGTIPLLPVPISFMLSLLGSQIAAGMLVGLISSSIAVHRFLR